MPWARREVFRTFTRSTEGKDWPVLSAGEASVVSGSAVGALFTVPDARDKRNQAIGDVPWGDTLYLRMFKN